jgi:hypothetical protein
MTTVTEIKAAIESLSPHEYCELMAVLHPTVDDDWDRQMKADEASGRLDQLTDGAGKTTVMAMLIAWPTVNAVRRPRSKNFTRGFPLVAPGQVDDGKGPPPTGLGMHNLLSHFRRTAL